MAEFKKFDKGKLRPSLLPNQAIQEVLKVLEFGAAKYGDFNWLNAEGVEWSRYLNALDRHLIKFKNGQNIDEESGLLELAHIATNVLMLLTYQLENIGNDDRDYRIGKVFGNVRINEFNKMEGNHRLYWCTCLLCNSKFSVYYNNLIKENTTQCGCQKDFSYLTTHVLSKHRIYNVWIGMHTRCYDDTAISYPNYGARGITICERWHTFENFIEDVGIPEEGLQIDRIDNDGPYCLENCRWVTAKENVRNNSRTRKFFINNTEYTLKELCEKYNMNRICVSKRLHMGWDLLTALTTPSVVKSKQGAQT